MADDEDSLGSTHVIFPIGEPEPEDSDLLQALDSISQWCDAVLDSGDAAEDPNCNPFAPRSSGADWLADYDSDSDRGISCFVTDLFERGGQSSEPEPEPEPEGLDGFDFGGLRIADFESESDCGDGGGGEVRVRGEDFDWEEIEHRGEDESDGPAILIDDEDEAVPATRSEIETMMEAVESFEWEIMMAINTLAANASLERESPEAEAEAEPEHDALLLDQFVGGAAARAGPPAAKGFVESLGSVEPGAAEELGRDGVACAVCKDRVSAEGTVKKLPCSHYFHSDCIVPWLGIRNTCPVCRFEVPTDDPDYERRKTRRAARPRNSHQVFSDFELFS